MVKMPNEFETSTNRIKKTQKIIVEFEESVSKFKQKYEISDGTFLDNPQTLFTLVDGNLVYTNNGFFLVDETNGDKLFSEMPSLIESKHEFEQNDLKEIFEHIKKYLKLSDNAKYAKDAVPFVLNYHRYSSFSIMYDISSDRYKYTKGFTTYNINDIYIKLNGTLYDSNYYPPAFSKMLFDLFNGETEMVDKLAMCLASIVTTKRKLNNISIMITNKNESAISFINDLLMLIPLNCKYAFNPFNLMCASNCGYKDINSICTLTGCTNRILYERYCHKDLMDIKLLSQSKKNPKEFVEKKLSGEVFKIIYIGKDIEVKRLKFLNNVGLQKSYNTNDIYQKNLNIIDDTQHLFIVDTPAMADKISSCVKNTNTIIFGSNTTNCTTLFHEFNTGSNFINAGEASWIKQEFLMHGLKLLTLKTTKASQLNLEKSKNEASDLKLPANDISIYRDFVKNYCIINKDARNHMDEFYELFKSYYIIKYGSNVINKKQLNQKILDICPNVEYKKLRHNNKNQWGFLGIKIDEENIHSMIKKENKQIDNVEKEKEFYKYMTSMSTCFSSTDEVFR